MVTAVYALYRKEGTTREEFAQYWLDEHTKFTKLLPHVHSYRIFPVISAADVEGTEADGFVVLDFETQEDHDACLQSDEMARAGEDAAVFTRHFDTYMT